MGRLISINDYGLSEKIVILSSTNPSKYGVRIALRGVYSSVLSLCCLLGSRRLYASSAAYQQITLFLALCNTL